MVTTRSAMPHPLTKSARPTSRGLSCSRQLPASTSPSAPAVAPTPSSVGRSRHRIRLPLVRPQWLPHDRRANAQHRSRARTGLVYPQRGVACHSTGEDRLHCCPKAGGPPSLPPPDARSHPDKRRCALLRPNITSKIPIAWRPALPRNGSLQQTSARMLARSAEPLSLDSRRTLSQANRPRRERPRRFRTGRAGTRAPRNMGTAFTVDECRARHSRSNWARFFARRALVVGAGRTMAGSRTGRPQAPLPSHGE